MGELAKVHIDRLKELKKTVEEGQQYFQDNAKRFEKFAKFVFKTSQTDDEIATLQELGKPTLEFNILEAAVSRNRGEFAKQQPSLTVRAADGIPISALNQNFIQTIQVVEAHLRAIFFDAANDMLDYNVYTDLLAGGYSVMRVYTTYVNEMSFEQNICVERVFDPTLTVFDPLARKSHKGDGRYCAELYPMTRKSFEDKYGEEAAKDIKFTRNLSGFNWSFQNEQEEIVLVCDFYEKKRRKAVLYKLTNGHTVTKKEYESFLEQWDAAGYIEQPPAVLKKRKTMLEYICRYRFCESKVLDYTETNFKHLPLVFVDGNSIVLKESGSYTQMTRPYVYHAEGIQRLKNFAGQSLANELENTIQHKFMVPIEAIPEKYALAYENVQKANTLVYNHFLDTNNPEITLPPPQVVNRQPIPPEITSTFKLSDEMTQAILGSYDPSQGINNAKLSGIAFARSAIQSNNSSMPYIVGYIKGLNRVAQIIVDLIPKYYRTPRSLPVLRPNGKREYVMINKLNNIYMNYDSNMLQVKVETGVNFAMQKEIALQTVIGLSQANQGFADFFNTEGLPTLLDNIEIRGIEDLKVKAEEWMKQQQQQQQVQAQQQQQQQQIEVAMAQKELQSPTRAEVDMMEMQERVKTDNANTAIKAQNAESQFLETLSKIRTARIDNELRAAEIEAENTRSQVEAAIKLGDRINDTLQRSMDDGREMDTGSD